MVENITIRLTLSKETIGMLDAIADKRFGNKFLGVEMPLGPGDAERERRIEQLIAEAAEDLAQSECPADFDLEEWLTTAEVFKHTAIR